MDLGSNYKYCAISYLLPLIACCFISGCIGTQNGQYFGLTRPGVPGASSSVNSAPGGNPSGNSQSSAPTLEDSGELHKASSESEDFQNRSRNTPPKRKHASLQWPVRGDLMFRFDPQSTAIYNGIGIKAPKGAPVKAAADGKIGHVGAMSFFGNVVLIEHKNRLVTVYAHLNKSQVKAGQIVKAGDSIGTVGATGRTDKPLLYFEVRSKSKPKDPLLFL